MTKILKVIEYKYAYLFVLLLLSSCTENKYSANDEIYKTLVPVENNKDNDLLESYEKFQTFNEFIMAGEGDAVKTPFVYVKKVKDTIMVKVSNCLDSVITYKYDKTHKCWYNERYLDWNKKELMKNDIYGPRKYSRYIFNDTIIEMRESYNIDNYNNRSKDSNVQFYIKTLKGCLQIQYLKEKVNFSANNRYNDIKRIIKEYDKRTNLMNIDRYVSIFGDDGYLWYKKETKGDILLYTCETKKETFTCKYSLNSLGEFGCGAGLEINPNDIMTYSKVNFGTEETEDSAFIETYVDKKAQFIGGQENLEKFICENIHTPVNAEFEGERTTVILTLKIDVFGKVVGHEISLSKGELLDNTAIEFCYKRLKFQPAIKDGKKVASWLVLPIRFIKENKK